MPQNEMKEKSDNPVRLNKFLSEAGVCSRREADRLIEAGRVSVDGKRAIWGQKVTEGEHVLVDGRSVRRNEEFVLLAVNKPAGVVCTTDTRWSDTTIYDVVDYPVRVFSIGRLDKNTEGLLLMTNQGDILNAVNRAANYHEKEYIVTVNREIDTDFLKRMSDGVFLEELGVKTRPCFIEACGKNVFRIILTQGLNRQIRRMCDRFGYKVKKLVRIRVMNITLGSLKPGEYRPVTGRELSDFTYLLENSKNTA